jgi:hypothetical protein
MSQCRVAQGAIARHRDVMIGDQRFANGLLRRPYELPLAPPVGRCQSPYAREQLCPRSFDLDPRYPSKVNQIRLDAGAQFRLARIIP